MKLRPLTLAYVGFALLGVLVLGAFLHEHVASRATPAPAAMKVQGSPATADQTGGIPSARPLFTLPDLTGHRHSIAEWDGHALMVNFWATWCAPCRREIPLLNALSTEYASKNVKVVGIAVDFMEDVQKFTARTPLHYDLLVGEEDGLEAARGFGVDSLAFPFTAFTDQRGHVLTVHIGELHEDQARAILTVVEQVDRGEVTAPQARPLIERALAALKRTDPS
jgi:thiol-disulfide isomerase/thioredoxin